MTSLTIQLEREKQLACVKCVHTPRESAVSLSVPLPSVSPSVSPDA
jgi:hypothetical protein